MVFSPEGAQQVLASQATNFRKEAVFYEEVRRSFGNGLLTAQDGDYQRQRRLIQPLFTPRRVASYADVMGVEAEALVARWSAAPGHETTATSLTFALHLLGKHPTAQQRARAEVDALLGDGRRPTAEDYPALPYLTRVLKEAMRLFPALPVVPRRSVAECVVAGTVIPAGADVLVCPYVTQRHPGYWQNPERFDPDRFTPEREATRHRYAWFPFGGGPRSCIGQHFSMLESVLGLATLLRAFEVEAVDTEVPLRQFSTLQPRGPVRIKLTPRERPPEFGPAGRRSGSHAMAAVAGRVA